jgi:dephospho-CoA kinase
VDEAEAIRRIRAQATDAERTAYADTVIENDGDRDCFLGRLDAFWAQRVGV